MAKLTRDQLNKWTSALPEGWSFDAYHYVGWGEKRISIDSPANDKGIFYRLTLEYYPETEGEGYMRRETGRQLPTVNISRYTPEGDGEKVVLCQVVRILTETAGEAQTKRNYNVLAKLAGEIDVDGYFCRAAEMDTGKQYNTMDDFTVPAQDNEQTEEPETEPETTDLEEATETATENTTEAATEPETAEPEQDTTEPENGAQGATEDAQEPEQATEEEQHTEEQPTEDTTAPDSFAALAMAYFTGRTVKEQKPASKTTEEPEKEPEPEEEPTPEPPPAPGYRENDNGALSEEERKALSAGLPVARKARYDNCVMFTCPYSDDVRTVYRANSYKERENVLPGQSGEFCGVLVRGNYYNSKSIKDISEKLSGDIERRLQEIVSSETDAAHAAANIEDSYTRKRLEDLKEMDYTNEAQKIFFRDEAPELSLYDWPQMGYGWDCIISYLLTPEEVIEKSALAFLCDRPERVYEGYIRYNRLFAALGAINADTSREEHTRKRIANSIGEQKTVRILLTNGEEVKVEARAVKGLVYRDWISDLDVSAPDRDKLPKEADGRPGDIHTADIVEIRHGGWVLYSA